MEFTYNIRAYINEVGGVGTVELHDTIDLGLGVDLVARILRIDTWILSGIEHVVGNDGYHGLNAWVSLDPDDVTWLQQNDARIVDLPFNIFQHGSVGDVGGTVRSLNFSYDFSSLYVITSRDLSFGCRTRSNMATKPEAEFSLNIWYEKFKPTANDLNVIIATRR